MSSDAGRGALPIPYNYVLYSLNWAHCRSGSGFCPTTAKYDLLPLTDNWFCQFWHCGYALQLQQKDINGIYTSLPTSDTNSPPDYWWYLVESTKTNMWKISLYSGKCIWQCRITEVHISRKTDWTGKFPYILVLALFGWEKTTLVYTLCYAAR